MGKAAILIDDAMKIDLEREASRSGATTSAVAEAAIDTYLRLRSSKRGVIEAAIAEADEGVFVSKQAMDRWVSSWGSENSSLEPEPDVFLKRDR